MKLFLYTPVAAQLIIKERITNAGGVPSMVMDLIETSLETSQLESLACGGAPASDTMPKDVLKKFKKVVDAYVAFLQS